MIGVTFQFDDRDPVWHEIPVMPDVGDMIVYETVPYRVAERQWFGTAHTWAACMHLTRVK